MSVEPDSGSLVIGQFPASGAPLGQELQQQVKRQMGCDPLPPGGSAEPGEVDLGKLPFRLPRLGRDRPDRCVIVGNDPQSRDGQRFVTHAAFSRSMSSISPATSDEAPSGDPL
jgi:hypothetical protein